MSEGCDSCGVGSDACGCGNAPANLSSPLVIIVAAVAAVILSLGTVVLSVFIAWMCFQKPDAANILILGVGGALGAAAAKNAVTVAASKLIGKPKP